MLARAAYVWSWVARYLGQQKLRHLLVLALVLRTAWALACPNEPTSDQVIYYTTAERMADGQGYVDEGGRAFNYWPVGYPAMLAVPFAVFGARPATVFGVNIVLGLLLVAGVHELTRLLAGRPAASVAATFAAVHPTLVLYTTCIASENAFMPGLVWTIIAFCRAAGAGSTSPRPRLIEWSVLAGVLAGATLMVRGTTLLTFGSLPLAFLLWRRSPRVAAASIAVFALALVVTTAPWSLRNQREFGRYSPLSFNGNANLWMGNHEGTTGGYESLPADVERLPLLEREAYLGKEVRRFWREHPEQLPFLAVRRTVDTLRSDTIAVVWNAIGIERRFGNAAFSVLRLLTTGIHWLVMLAVTVVTCRWVMGVVRQLPRAGSLLERLREAGQLLVRSPGEPMLLATMAGVAIPFVLMVSGNRYHMPNIPFALALIAIGFTTAPEAPSHGQ